MAAWKLRQDFLSVVGQNLVRECIRSTALTPTTIKVRDLGRVGKSGARLLLCRLVSGGSLVVKFHKEKKIRTEYQAINDVKNYFLKDIGIRLRPAYGTGADGERYGALLYFHQAGTADAEIERAKELREVVYEEDHTGFSLSDDDVVAIFRKLWRHFRTAREKVRNGDVILRSEYADYLRPNVAPKVLSSILNVEDDQKTASILGRNLCNPLWFVKQHCFDTVYKGKRGPVHGDLHGNNVILDEDGDVHLIDFAWAAKYKHILVDYVLMENSLRFLLFPQHVNPERQLEADILLLNYDGPEKLSKVDWNCSLAKHYRRLGCMLREIREQAKKYLASQDDCGFGEYLATQFLILYGQVSYPDYNQLMAARALALIAEELQGLGFLAGSGTG